MSFLQQVHVAAQQRAQGRQDRGRPVVVGIGEESIGQPIDGMGKALADRLGTRRAAFPGDHMGFAPYPDRFA